MKTVFITGITGFAGSFLSELLVDRGYTVVGTFLSEASINKTLQEKNIVLKKCDLLNKDSVNQVIQEVKPDIIFHLAALTSPGDSFKDPVSTITTNASIELNLLEAVRVHTPIARVIIISSAEVYGLVRTEDLPIDESTELRPTSPYAVSKIAQDYFGLQYFLSYKLDTIRLRPFNHIGPRQSTAFVVSAFAKKIVEIEKGFHEPVLTVGNLEARRDFTDVRDMVRAYELIMNKGQSGDVYNIGSGKSHKIADVLHMLLGLTDVKIEIKEDKNLLRPSDNPDLVCDNSKIVNLTGWKVEISLETSLKDILDYWRKIL